MTAGKKRNGEIDLLRFLFAVSILLFHWNCNFNLGIFSNGYIGVEFFFLVSGYLMARSAKKISAGTDSDIARSTWQFIGRKFVAFYSYYLCAVLLHLIIRVVIIDEIGLKNLIQGLLTVIPTASLTFMGLNADQSILYVGNTWYLSAMLIGMLILYPLLLKSYHQSAKILFPLIALFGIGFLYHRYGSLGVWKNWSGFCYVGILRALAELALGACLYELTNWIRAKNETRVRKPLEKAFFTIVKVLCYLIVFAFASGMGKAKLDLYIMLFCAVGVVLSFSESGYTLPESGLTKYLGKISLPIFIFHGFIRWSVKDFIGEKPVSVTLFFVMVILSILVSVLLLYVTDFLKAGIRRIGSRWRTS